jgi:ABC-type lipoprotein export system ATPase subunit
MSETGPYILCKQVVRAYRVGDHELVALRGIDFEMQRGEMVAINGPSGVGKSTLMNLVGGLDQPTAGQLLVAGQNLLELRGRALAHYRLRQVGFVWQRIERNLLPHRSALRNVTLPMMMARVSPWQRARRANDLLDAVGLKDQGHKHPAQLSGGQQQRVAIAVALANQPEILLADEPTGALDRRTAAQVMELICALRERYGLTVLIVTHDAEIAAYADRVLTLRDGALGQDIAHADPETPVLDSSGSIRLPQAAQSYLNSAPQIAVEIRPEGVLLRPETDEDLDAGAALQAMLPQDAPPRPHTSRVGRWFKRKQGQHARRTR